MSGREQIEAGWSRMPADLAPVAGKAVERLFAIAGPNDSNLGRELIRDGELRRDPPAWVEGRVADWWLVGEDEEVAVPLVWKGDELLATLVLFREREQREATLRDRLNLEAQARARSARRQTRTMEAE
jgi:hypothetical protein